ncbi:NlpC/P60 family protein [Streptacidiphilus sp. EB129]|uniref:C40 family peptidase n=1 Tax=Streptacidiphilus sp. EB129 TaxID=3156262 RepID=UPI0035142072
MGTAVWGSGDSSGKRTALSATRPWLRGVLRCGIALAAASLAVLPMAGPALAAGAATPVTGTTIPTTAQSLTSAEQVLLPVLNQLHATYQLAEAATQKYDALAEQLQQAQTDEAELQVLVDNAQAGVEAGNVVAGQLAAAEYRNGGNSQLGELLFANDPQAALHAEELLAMVGKSQAEFLDQLKTDRVNLTQAQSAAAVARGHAAQLLAAQAVARDAINKQLQSVEQQVSTLTGAQQQELSLLEQKEADAAQLAFLASGILGKDGTKPSAAGAAAVSFAFQQLGKPYVWGGAGPDVFDCSGLTSQAWLHAGVPIPRTSEEQWAQLTHVPLSALRPGDLIIYFAGASHVAIYIGDGLVIQAPRPGAFVDVAPIAQNPILGAVRPDPSSPSLGAYTAPTIPTGAQGPQPIAPPVTPPVLTPPVVPPTTRPTPKPTGTPSTKPTPTPTPTPTPSTTVPSQTPSPTTTPSASPSAAVAGPSTPSVPSTPSPSATP